MGVLKVSRNGMAYKLFSVEILSILRCSHDGRGRGDGAKKNGGNLQMNLNDTVKMMNSANYKERFKAEYWQTKIRYEKLHRMTVKYEAGTLDFEPDCELSLLLEQKKYMGLYLNRLEVRAEVERIDLEALKDGKGD